MAPGILSNTDVTSYTIPIPADVVTPISITATLRYQTTSKEYVDFLLDEATDNAFPNDCIPRSTGLPGATRAAVLHDMWETHGRAAPVTIATATAAVEATDAFLCAKSKVSKDTAKFVPVTGLDAHRRLRLRHRRREEARQPVRPGRRRCRHPRLRPPT